MQYLFHLHGDCVTRDIEGREFTSRHEAVRFARDEASAMASLAALNGCLDLSHYVEVTSEDRRNSFRMGLADVVAVTTSAPALPADLSS